MRFHDRLPQLPSSKFTACVALLGLRVDVAARRRARLGKLSPRRVLGRCQDVLWYRDGVGFVPCLAVEATDHVRNGIYLDQRQRFLLGVGITLAGALCGFAMAARKYGKDAQPLRREKPALAKPVLKNPWERDR